MKLDIDQLTIVHNPAKHRFEARIGDQLAVAAYTSGKDYIVFAHTQVPEQWEGQGIATKLAYTALEYAKENNLEVMPLCSFFAGYMRKHPEYKSLLRPGFPV